MTVLRRKSVHPGSSSIELNDPIDGVVSFVNSSKHSWRKQFAGANSIEPDPARYTYNGEIYFNLLSLQKHAPWLRQVFIVVQDHDQIFDCSFLKNFKHKIVFVTHTEIIPQDFLPTFNSNVIECFIHTIPGLAEIFLLINDDTILAKPLSKRKFISFDHKLLVPAVEGYEPDDRFIPPDSWEFMFYNSAWLFRQSYGYSPPWTVNILLHYPWVATITSCKHAMSKVRWYVDHLKDNKVRKYRNHSELGDIQFLRLCQWAGAHHAILIPSGDFKAYDLHGLDHAVELMALNSESYDFSTLQELHLLNASALQQICLEVYKLLCTDSNCLPLVQKCYRS
jgi:hypothetical protein